MISMESFRVPFFVEDRTMAKCKQCATGVAVLCSGCCDEIVARQECRIEHLQHEIRYLRLRCLEECVAVRSLGEADLCAECCR
jgi:hypothetical protein